MGPLLTLFLIIVGVGRRLRKKNRNICFLMTVVRFHTISRVHRAHKTEDLVDIWRQNTCHFSDIVLGSQNVDFGSHFGEPFGTPKPIKMASDEPLHKIL